MVVFISMTMIGFFGWTTGGPVAPVPLLSEKNGKNLPLSQAGLQDRVVQAMCVASGGAL